jgi:copper transport protein
MKSLFDHFYRYKILSSAVLALTAALLFISISQAHANLLRSDPADGAILPEPPGEIQLWFDEPVSGKFSSAQLFNADSQPIEINGIRGDASDPTTLILDIPDLPEGVFSLLWKTLSEVDGHYNQGLLVFGVGELADLGTATIASPEDTAPPIQEVILRWFNFIATALVIGSLAMIQLVINPTAAYSSTAPQVSDGLRSAGRRIFALAAWAAGLGILVGFGFLIWQTTSLKANLPEGISFADAAWQVVSQTQWGLVWSIRQAAFMILTWLLIASSRKASKSLDLVLTRSIWFTIDLLALSLVLLQALSSHASGLIDDTLLAIIADGLHLLAACLWVGGLISLATGILPLVRDRDMEAGKILRAGWQPFSLIAASSVGILVATGLYNTARQVASPDALLTTLYGQSLMLKIGLVIFVGMIGLTNSMLLHPRLAAPLARLLNRPRGWTPLKTRRLPSLIVIEGTIGLLVLLATGLITTSPAPRNASFTTVEEKVPSSLTQSVDDLVVTLNTKPNRPGQNVFTVFTRSTRRPPPAEIARVILRFDYMEQDLGRTSATAEEIDLDRYSISGNYLSLPGKWQVQVVVRRLGLEDSVASFDWTVIPPGELRPTVFSKYPWSQYLILAAAVMLLLIVIIASLLVLRRKNPAQAYNTVEQNPRPIYEYFGKTYRKLKNSVYALKPSARFYIEDKEVPPEINSDTVPTVINSDIYDYLKE